MEGYVLVASGQPKYFQQAAEAARSIQFFDQQRKICLACDNEALIPPETRALFDHVVRLTHTDTRRGTEHHLYLNQLCPFERSLYVDADCLMANRRIHDIWEKLKSYHVTFPGRKLESGEWRGDIASLRRRFGLDYVVQLNGGVFYFDKSREAAHFFATAQSLFENHPKDITSKHNTGGGLANEPIWGVTMALTKTPEFPLSEHLNVSTLRTERWSIDSEPSISLWKDGRTWNPVVCHFLGLGGPKCPNDLYRAFNVVIAERVAAAKGATSSDALASLAVGRTKR